MLSIEFIDSSPLKNGVMTAPGNEDIKVEQAGRFQFKCILDAMAKIMCLIRVIPTHQAAATSKSIRIEEARTPAAFRFVGN